MNTHIHVLTYTEYTYTYTEYTYTHVHCTYTHMHMHTQRTYIDTYTEYITVRARIYSDHADLKVLATTPSVHSWDTGSNCPKSWPIVMDLGLITLNMAFCSSICPLSFSSVSVSASTSMTFVLPAKGPPT